ncbi:MAG: phosphoribosyltransferase [Promethearchaeota archaeon]
MEEEDFVILEEEIRQRVQELAKEIYHFYSEKKITLIHVIFVLTGAFIFTSDLIRELNSLGLKMKIKEIIVHSYRGMYSGEILLEERDFLDLKLNNAEVLVLDDILDTGKTLQEVKKKILEIYAVKSLELCVFLKKENNERQVDLDIRFVGFNIPNIFVVGYGLDYNGEYRELPYIINLAQLMKNQH